MGKAYRILLVEDDELDARLVKLALAELVGEEFQIQPAATLAEAESRLASGAFDAVILDLNLPDSRGMDTLGAVRKADPKTPVLVLTGIREDGMAHEARSRGAMDCLVKGRMTGRQLLAALRMSRMAHRKP